MSVQRQLPRRSIVWRLIYAGVALGLFLGCAIGASIVSPHVVHAQQATPVIVDTDMYSDVDDVGALAVLNALTTKGEAKLVGVVMDTSSQYSAQCASAVDTYFGHPDIPIGITYPITSDRPTTTPDYIYPCAQNFPEKLQNSGTIPSALDVYRQTLAAQPDGSVVIAAIGFEGRLSELLHSSADNSSSLNGHDLIAQKVKELVVMGGGYPSLNAEFNFAGDPAAAADVANNWPTKIAYTGFEVGNIVHTGHTLSSTTPSSDPVRFAYETYVGAGNDRQSWDLTAAYYAIRQQDGLFAEVGNGSNSIDSGNGSNTWVSSPVKNQVYLTMPDASAVERALESLITYVPDVSVANAGFESPGSSTNNIPSWNVWTSDNGASADAAFTETYGDSHSGNWHLAEYKPTPYQLSVYQDVTVPNGTYTVTAWTESTGGMDTHMELHNWSSPDQFVRTSIPTNTSTYQQVSLTVTVTTGTLTVGFYADDTSGDHWTRVDDVSIAAS